MDGYVTIGTRLDDSMIDKQISLLEDKLEGLEEEFKTLENAKPFDGQAKELTKLGNEIIATRKKLEGLIKKRDEMNRSGFANLQSSIDGIGNSMTRVIKKVAKWGLAIFGVRAAYQAVQSAANTLSQYNEQIGTDIEYIRFALASTLQPVVEGLIRLVYKLLAIINAISVKLFNYNLFANASSKAFGKTAKSAEKIKKSLAGFDEMNILQDTSSGDTSGGGVTPSMDLSKIDQDATAYVEKMKSVADTVTSFWEKDWEDYFNNASGDWDWFIKGILLTLEGFYKIFKGIFEVIGGVIDIFVGIFTGDVDKIKEGWDKVVKGFVDILVGVIDILLGLIMTFLGLIKELVLELWRAIVGILSTIGGWIYNYVIKPIADFFVGLWNGIINGVKSAIEIVKNVFSSVVNFFKGIISTIVNLFKTIGTKVGDVIGGAFKAVVNSVLKAIENILNSPIRAINGLIGVINKVPGINLGKLSTFRLPRLARGGIINQPGRGIPVGYGQAIAGERGQEGVLPLTDSQQMSLLGEAIGKYVRIDNIIENYIDGRKLNRILQSSNDRTRFAMNG